MDTHSPEVHRPEAAEALGTFLSLPSKVFQSPIQSIPPLSKLPLTPSSSLIPWLHLVSKE